MAYASNGDGGRYLMRSAGPPRIEPPKIKLLYLEGEFGSPVNHFIFRNLSKTLSDIAKACMFPKESFLETGRRGRNCLATLVINDVPSLAIPIDDGEYEGMRKGAVFCYQGPHFFRSLQDSHSTPSPYGTMVQPKTNGHLEGLEINGYLVPKDMLAISELVTVDFRTEGLLPVDMAVIYDPQRKLEALKSVKRVSAKPRKRR